MKTLKLRIKDKHAKVLTELAQEANVVWNYGNRLCSTFRKNGVHPKKLPFELQKYTKGASKECGLHSQTIQAINEELLLRMQQFSKVKLRWRVSGGARKSLGWIPFKASGIKYINGQLKYGNHHFSLWDSYGLSKYTIKTGCFTQDSRGRWYACLVVADYPKLKSIGTTSIGIDFGLKTVATCSDGYKIENKKFFYKYQEQLAKSQRANTKKKTRNIHAKIKNSRQDYLQKESTKLVQQHALIVVGNLSAKALTKTKMAKSTYDSGFSMFNTMLRYKCQQAGVLYDEVSEKYTTQICSCCGLIGDNSPRGRIGLRIREWQCHACGITHDRDINAALNILAVGHGRLVVGTPVGVLLPQGIGTP